MIYGAILAGGTGTRMGGSLPKQFIELCGKPILIWTIEKMLKVKEFDYIYVAVHPDFMGYLKKILGDFSINDSRIRIINGGKERINSIENVMEAISNNEITTDDVVVIHDGVRPFVSKKILKDSIKTAMKYGACVATVPAVDTMYVLDETGFIKDIPPRKTIFNGQAPDSFKVNVLKDAMDKLTAKERQNITGTVQICSLKGYPVKTIEGDYKNIKITTKDDIQIAENILRTEKEYESVCS